MTQKLVFVECPRNAFMRHIRSSPTCSIVSGQDRENGGVCCGICEQVFVRPLRGNEKVIIFDGGHQRSAQLKKVLEGGKQAEIYFERGEERYGVTVTLPFSYSPQEGYFALAL
jgi:hypothetical protein